MNSNIRLNFSTFALEWSQLHFEGVQSVSDKKAALKSPHVDSREALIMAGKRVFAQKGFEGATVKDLADEAGVNVSLVSYHFGGKENLYRSCLESFGTERLEAAERVLKTPATAEEFKLRLQMFGEDMMAIYLTQADTCKMIHRGMDNMDPITAEVFQKIFVRIYDALLAFVRAAQKNGILRAEFEPDISTTLLFGALMHVLRSQDIARMLGHPTLEDSTHAAKIIGHWLNGWSSGFIKSSTKDDRGSQ